MKTKIFSVLAITLVTLVSCDDKETKVDCDAPVKATVRDLALDGCGFVFELSDGTKLEPMRMLYCGTPPLPKEVTEDPLYGFEFVDGKKVLIGYIECAECASICMAGPIVKITCITEDNAVTPTDE